MLDVLLSALGREHNKILTEKNKRFNELVKNIEGRPGKGALNFGLLLCGKGIAITRKANIQQRTGRELPIKELSGALSSPNHQEK